MNTSVRQVLSACVLSGIGCGVYLLALSFPGVLDIRVKHWVGLLGYLACFMVFKLFFCGSSIKKYMTVTSIAAFLHACFMLRPRLILAWGCVRNLAVFVQWIFVIMVIAIIGAGLVAVFPARVSKPTKSDRHQGEQRGQTPEGNENACR